jgi:thioredoxin reductase
MKDSQKVIKTSEGDFTANAVIVALGSERVNLEVPEKKNSSAGCFLLRHL